MQQDTIAQFLQVWGPALGPAGAESRSAASILSSIPIPDRNVFCTCNCLSQQGTALGTRLRVSGGPCVAPVAAWQGWSPKHPSLRDRDSPAPSHPRHAGKVGRRNSTEVCSLSWDKSQKFILVPHHPGCRSRVHPLRTWYSSATPMSLLSDSSVPSSAEPFCPSWELLPESVLLLRDESWESSSVRSMVTGVDTAERRLELCMAEAGEGECSRERDRGSRDLSHITPHSPHHTQPCVIPQPCSRDGRGGARE